MKIRTSTILFKLQNIWPDLEYGYKGPTSISLADGEYWMPTKSKVKKLLWEGFIDTYKYKAETFDCDEFSLLLHAFVVQERYVQIEKREVPKEEWLPWAFGQVTGIKFQGKKTHHAINIVITSDNGVMLIEPQNDKIWKATYPNDLIYRVRM